MIANDRIKWSKDVRYISMTNGGPWNRSYSTSEGIISRKKVPFGGTDHVGGMYEVKHDTTSHKR